ncbi:pentapeptide repeat-containing protein [Streptomyces lateritius]|uniref:Pentapeptide repeat-containing protein n=1 Tax=Streptomyces lateritius TaxID=67313 RepID=A0ABW6YJ89_9ACTN
MTTSPTPIPAPPSWPHCGHGGDAADPIGCRGIHVFSHGACLAHLSDTDRDAYLNSLAAGSSVDHSGTPFTPALLSALLEAVRDSTGRPVLGPATFADAQFSGVAAFERTRFSGHAQFKGAQFLGEAGFEGAEFSADARFDRAQFSDAASFGGALFGFADFEGAEFFGDVRFGETQFSGTARFAGVKFSAVVLFSGAQFDDHAVFDRARFAGFTRFDGAQFLGPGRFAYTRFSEDAHFHGVQFAQDALFMSSQFSGRADFLNARFAGTTWFDRGRFSGEFIVSAASFSGGAWFDQTWFAKTARFVETQFEGRARFPWAWFEGRAEFRQTRFSGSVVFGGAKFSMDAQFAMAEFGASGRWGPVVCDRTLNLSGAVFEMPVTMEIAASQLLCQRTRWDSTATLRLRYATVDLTDAVLSAPVAVTAHPVEFVANGGRPDETKLSSRPAEVQVMSVQGVDAAHLVLTDTDLTDCQFSGAFHLDQLRLEGRTTFAFTPTGWHRNGIRPVHWTRRRALAEEHHWRAQSAGQPQTPPGQTPSKRKWRPGPHHPDPGLTPDPEDVAAAYRQLRKAFEDGKNEPGAADFYYGECEMRRHDRTSTTRSERGLLWAYWLLSGYGLRASRALGWLAASMLVTLVLLMGFGLPQGSPKQQATGTVPAGGGKVTLTIDKEDPKNPSGERFTGKRFDKALSVTLNSVVFRSSGQDLTTAGTYIEMTSRLLEPALLALAVLAVRGRIKR